jgi:putative transposase
LTTRSDLSCGENMAGTFTQIHIHCVFAVKHRNATITGDWSESLNRYISGIVNNHHHKVIAINNMPDHLHLFLGLTPHQALSDLIRVVKGESSAWINRNRFSEKKFNWQEGYGAFSYPKSHVNIVADYVTNQKLHHSNKTFLEEYRGLLEEFAVEYDPLYIFKELI